MNKAIGLLLVAAVMMSASQAYPKGSKAKGPERKMTENSAPDFSLKDLDDKDVTLEQHFGKKLVVLEFWATWCGPCRYTMAQIHNIKEKVKGKPVEFLSIDQAEDKKKVSEFAKARGLKMRILLDFDSSVSRAYGVYGLPTIFVIDMKGEVRAKIVGYRADLETAMEQFLDQLLAEKTAEEANK